MTRPKEAVLFVALSRADKERGILFREIKDKLLKLAALNNHTIIKTIEKEDVFDWSQSNALDEIIEFVEPPESPVTFICYSYPLPHEQKQLNEKWQNLISTKKLELFGYAHPCFTEPPNKTKIWRYMSLAKFVDLVQSQKLFFTRSDRLRSDDKYEGALFTKAYKESSHAFSKLLSSPPNVIEELQNAHPNIDFETIKRNIMINSGLQKYHEEQATKYTFINCWHMSEEENFAMWKIYTDSSGVCIQSTYERLCNGFADNDWAVWQDVNRIYIGKVLYINRSKDIIPFDNGFWPFMHKGCEFSYENELRCIISDMRQTGIAEPLKVPVKLDHLIEGIFVSPFAPKWLADIVQGLCHSYGINEELLRQSSLE